MSRLAYEFWNVPVVDLRAMVRNVKQGIDNASKAFAMNLAGFGDLCKRLGGAGNRVRVYGSVTFRDKDTGEYKTFHHTAVERTDAKGGRVGDPLRNALTTILGHAVAMGYRPDISAIEGGLKALESSGRVEVREIQCL